VANLTVVLDDGGVLNDNARRAPQWQRLVGAFFPDVLGGTPEGWAEANRVGLESFWSCPAPPRSARATVADAIRAHRFRGLQLMCRHLGIPWPPEDEAIQIAQRAHRYVRRRVCAAVPGAIEAVRRLRAAGTPPAHRFRRGVGRAPSACAAHCSPSSQDHGAGELRSSPMQ
jgi:hypothetical protein